MATYRISGIWKQDRVVTHYALQRVLEDGSTAKSVKTAKEDTIALLEQPGTVATTGLWRPETNLVNWQPSAGSQWAARKIPPAGSARGLTDELEHLINFSSLF